MHSSIPLFALFAAGVLGSPLSLFDRLQLKNIVRDVVTEVAVTQVVTVTVFGQAPTATSTSAIAKVHKAYYSGAYRHWHHTRPRSTRMSTRMMISTVLPPSTSSIPAAVSPTSISTSEDEATDVVDVPTTSDAVDVSTTSDVVDVSTTSDVVDVSTTSDVVDVSTTSDVVVVPTTSEVVSVPTSTPSAAAPSSVSTPSDGSPLSGGISLLTTVNKYRQLYSLPTLSWSSVLTENALKTGTDGGGVTQTHQLNPGSFAQVITPGMSTAVVDLGGDTPFELSYVAWLCEVSSDSQLSAGGVNQCDLVEKVLHMRYSSTGHYDILTSKKYTQIGCAFARNPGAAATSVYQGLWVCDLAF
ncbi:MAG: hypothetical protein Q9187_008953 [Circinaria calcarea]